jgi:hypothetical protein
MTLDSIPPTGNKGFSHNVFLMERTKIPTQAFVNQLFIAVMKRLRGTNLLYKEETYLVYSCRGSRVHIC